MIAKKSESLKMLKERQLRMQQKRREVRVVHVGLVVQQNIGKLLAPRPEALHHGQEHVGHAVHPTTFLVTAQKDMSAGKAVKVGKAERAAKVERIDE